MVVFAILGCNSQQEMLCAGALTPSLPQCHLKKNGKNVEFETLPCEMAVIKKHGTESRRVRGPENMVCRRVRASFIPEILKAVGSEGVNYKLKLQISEPRT